VNQLEDLMNDKCPTGCGRSRQPDHMMCRTCWFKVPAALRHDVWHTWRRYLRTASTSDRKRYQQAREAAIASVP
jgi:hypothetical protein